MDVMKATLSLAAKHSVNRKGEQRILIQFHFNFHYIARSSFSIQTFDLRFVTLKSNQPSQIFNSKMMEKIPLR